MLKHLLSVILLISFSIMPVLADVHTWPAPAGTESSDQYRVEIVQDGKINESFVYVTNAQLPEFNRSKTTAFSYFDFTGKISVRVTKLNGEFAELQYFLQVMV